MEKENYVLFKSPDLGEEYLHLYDDLISQWPMKPDSVDVKTDFGITHVNVIGDSNFSNLILIPGFGANSTSWFANIGALSKKFRVFAVDTIGQPGRSIPSTYLQASTTAEWLNNVIKELALPKVNIAGVSLGGWITLEFALKYPERVNRIALLDPAASFAPMSFSFMIHSLFPIMIHPTRNGLINYFRWLTRGRSTNEQWGELMILGILNCKPVPPIRAIPFTDAQLRSCQTETMLLVGEDSVIYNPNQVIKRAERYLPKVTTQIISNASHGLNYEQADLVNSKLISFLSN